MTTSLVRPLAEEAKQAAVAFGQTSSAVRSAAVEAIAAALEQNEALILSANARDIEEHPELSTALQDRLRLTPARIRGMVEGVRMVAGLADPLGRELTARTLANGLKVRKVAVPFGVVAVIYEARPNVTVDTAALCVKTGNCVVLRGSAHALHSNRALATTIKEALQRVGISPSVVQLIDDVDRRSVAELLTLRDCIDVAIPRGGAALISHVVETATIPVIETGAGNCHLFVDASAEVEMACRIAVNAKTQRPSVCNAIETLLVHESWAAQHLAAIAARLREAGVELRGCAQSRALVADILPAEAQDWDTEYLDLILAVKVVKDVQEAVAHINRHGTKHSESIITQDEAAVHYFFGSVDAAALYHNASTRFTDGFEFGLGAEIGISTQKLHARGPMGLEELTTYKYLVEGTGQIRA